MKKGDKVTVLLTGAGYTTKELGVVLKVTNSKTIWIDNGPGNDPSGPFDARTGRYLGAGVPGFSKRISFT